MSTFLYANDFDFRANAAVSSWIDKEFEGDPRSRVGLFEECTEEGPCVISPLVGPVLVISDQKPKVKFVQNQAIVQMSVIGEFSLPREISDSRIFKLKRQVRSYKVSLKDVQGSIKLNGILPRFVGICSFEIKLDEYLKQLRLAESRGVKEDLYTWGGFGLPSAEYSDFSLKARTEWTACMHKPARVNR